MQAFLLTSVAKVFGCSANISCAKSLVSNGLGDAVRHYGARNYLTQVGFDSTRRAAFPAPGHRSVHLVSSTTTSPLASPIRPSSVAGQCSQSFHAHARFTGPLGSASILSRRSLSLFARQATLPPLTLVRLNRLEAEANAFPEDLEKQVALWEELVRLPAGCQRIISKYERVSEFDPESPLVRSPEIFQLYLQALVNTAQSGSVQSAVRRRDAILAAPREVKPTPPPEPLSPSQEIAKRVLAGDTAVGKIRRAAGMASATGAPVAEGAEGAVDGTLLSGSSGGKTNPVHVVVEESKGYTFFRIVRFVVLTFVYSFIALTVLSLLLENSGLLKAGGPPVAEFEAPAGGKVVTFADVHGVDEAKHELQEVVQFLKDPTTFSTLGGRLPKGVLLTGPPGTGKTMLARAVAGEAGVPFLFASGSEFDEMFVGVGAKRIRELFAAARKKQPSIVFIDELDAIGSRRSARDQQYVKQTLNQLLVELDGFTQSEGVIVIAATNFPETLDQALVRPGRFDKKIAVPLPDILGRMQILKHHMQGVLTEAGVDNKILARGTPGFSGADLQNMVNQAAVQASREGSKHVTLKHFEWAKDKIVMGSERKSAFISEPAKRLTAYHEGGHTLVALYTAGAMPLHKVTCVPRGHSLGLTLLLPEADRETSVSFGEFLAEIDVCMGGRVAEELIYGKQKVTSGARSDLMKASQTAKAMVKNYGFSDKIGPVYYDDSDTSLSSEKKHEIETEIRTLLEEGEARARAILVKHEAELHRLAEALVEYETLNLEEVKKVIKGEVIRDGKTPESTL